MAGRARLTTHTAFDLTSAPDAYARQSIEVHMLVFFVPKILHIASHQLAGASSLPRFIAAPVLEGTDPSEAYLFTDAQAAAHNLLMMTEAHRRAIGRMPFSAALPR